MDIEDIINRVRYTSTASDSQRDFSTPPRSESRDQSLPPVEDEHIPKPEPKKLPRHAHGHVQAAHRPKDGHHAFKNRPEKTLEPKQPSPAPALAEQVTPRANAINRELGQRPTVYPFQWPAEAAYNAAWHHLRPVFVPATAFVPVYTPFQSHFAPTPSPPAQPPPPPPQQSRTANFQQKDTAKSRSRGVLLPPLPESLRRNTEPKKKHMTAKRKKKRERHPRAVEEYDHLSTEEALEELAHRGIDTAHIQQTSTEARKAEMVKLLQRADRNNNRGRGSSTSSGRTILREVRAE